LYIEDEKNHLDIHSRVNTPDYEEKRSLLTIELLPWFGFSHQTPKPGIFDH
jgi:hypothetical protein